MDKIIVIGNDGIKFEGTVKVFENDNIIESLIDKYYEIAEKEKALKMQKEIIAAEIKDSLEGKEMGITDNYKITNNQVETTKFDSSKFKTEQLEIYNNYLKTSKSTRFNISKLN